jgi:hypothetical protein
MDTEFVFKLQISLGYMQRRFIKRRDYEKIAVKINMVSETTSYTGRYEDLEFEGDTVGDEIDIKDVLARMLTANKDIPESLVSTVTLVVGYIELMVNAGVKFAAASYGYEFRGDCEVGAKVSIFYETGAGGNDNQYVGWVATLRAYFEGHDGLTHEAWHEVKKTLRFGDKLDVDMLRTELSRLVKIAYNAHKGGSWRAQCS